jgi:hypothetical protein
MPVGGGKRRCFASVRPRAFQESFLSKTNNQAGQRPAQNGENHTDEEGKVVIVVDGKGDGKVMIVSEDWAIIEFRVNGDPGIRTQGNGNSRGKCDPFKRSVLALGAASIIGAGVLSAVSGNFNYLTAVAAVAVPAMLWVIGG